MCLMHIALCDTGSGFGTIRCAAAVNNCPGSAGSYCHPYHIWSSTEDGSASFTPYLASGTFNLTGGCSGRWCTYTYALGVRCVLDLGSNNTNILCRLCVVLDNFTIVTGTFSFGKNTSSFVTAILISAPCSADGLEATARAPLPVHMMLTTATRSTYGLRYQAVTLILLDS